MCGPCLRRGLLVERLTSAVWPGEGPRSMLLWSRQPNRAARSVAATSTTFDHWLRAPMTFSSNVVELIQGLRSDCREDEVSETAGGPRLSRAALVVRQRRLVQRSKES